MADDTKKERSSTQPRLGDESAGGHPHGGDDSGGTTSGGEPIIGIDLGTTNSLVAWCDEAGPRILPSAGGQRILPSVVRLSEQTGKVEAIGDESRRHAVEHPERTIYSAKRLMGRAAADLDEDERRRLAYNVVEGEHNTARIKVGEHVVTPQQVSAMILAELRDRAEAALGRPVRKAVVTVPAYFDDAQRQATRDAGRIAGLEIVRIVNEPTAAALAYGIGIRGQGSTGVVASATHATHAPKPDGSLSLNTKTNPEACASDPQTPDPEPHPHTQTVAVFDLGGGTFDISILRLQQTERGSVDQVIATAGDTHLGGDDVDQMIVSLIQQEISEQFFEGEAISFPPSTRQAFRNFAEAAKIRLSTEDAAPLQIDLGEGRTYERVLGRDELEAMIEPWLARALDRCRRALRDAKMTAGDIDRVVMVGGSTRIPAVQKGVRNLFEREPYTALDPDEVVALGAAVQASILAGLNRGMLLLDVIPLSLGIETMGGAVAKLIMANQTIPARATEQFTTYAEGQTNVKIHVLQGERELVRDCRSLGQFELRGIPPMPAGLPKIEVTFLVDANGILNVQAVEQRSGKRASIQVVPNHGLTREEVDRMEAESYEHAQEDMTAHRLIDLKMNAQLDIRHIRKQLERVGEQIDEAYRREVEDHIAKVEGFIEQGADADAEAFAQALTAMDHATIRLAEMNIARTLREEQDATS